MAKGLLLSVASCAVIDGASLLLYVTIERGEDAIEGLRDDRATQESRTQARASCG